MKMSDVRTGPEDPINQSKSRAEWNGRLLTVARRASAVRASGRRAGHRRRRGGLGITARAAGAAVGRRGRLTARAAGAAHGGGAGLTARAARAAHGR